MFERALCLSSMGKGGCVYAEGGDVYVCLSWGDMLHRCKLYTRSGVLNVQL